MHVGDTLAAATSPSQVQRQLCRTAGGCAFCCSDHKQADTFINTVKRISEHVSAECKHDGGIRSSIIHTAKIVIPVPKNPPVLCPDGPSPEERVAQMIFKGKLEACIKRKWMLDDDIQKAHSLVIRQCTDLLQSKLKQQAQEWAAVSQNQDADALIGAVETVTFKFEDQTFFPLALCQFKNNAHNLCEGNMTNQECLQRFQNLADVAPVCNGQLDDQAIVDVTTKKLCSNVKCSTLADAQKQAVQSAASNLHLATIFIHQSDPCPCSELCEELENSFAKGNDDPPDNPVSACNLIDEHKSWQPTSATPDSSGAAFAQEKGKGKEK
jgi:hypothetical protein